jgi:hypothetical protein
VSELGKWRSWSYPVCDFIVREVWGYWILRDCGGNWRCTIYFVRWWGIWRCIISFCEMYVFLKRMLEMYDVISELHRQDGDEFGENR